MLVVLTALFWEWSGLASIGVFYLLLVAPLVTAAFAMTLRRQRAVSAYHRNVFVVSIGYTGLMLVLVLSWIGIGLVR